MPLLPENAPFTPQQRAWLDGFLSAALGLEAPAFNGAAPVSNAAAPTPFAAPATSISPALNGASPSSAPIPQKIKEEPKAEPKLEIEPAKPAFIYNRDDPFPARVIHVRPLSGEDSEKDVRTVALDLTGSGLTYEAGDALGLYPENDHDLVEEILEVLGATGEEPVVTPESRIVPARIALSKGYDITRVGEELLQLLAGTAHDETEAATLRELAEEDARDWLIGRDVLDVLRHFPSMSAATSEVIAALMPLQPRLYSIASSQKAFPTQVHLTIGIVRYHANERARKGVASTFVAERVGLAPGQRVSVFVHPAPSFRLPENGQTPVIMVGPGTGIAPFRSFLQERRASGASGQNWLFFGDQRAHCDFLYRGELDEHLGDGSLSRLDTAFSRDQAEKIYVQTRMLENAAELWNWLEDGAHFYVCGDAKRMAKDVDNALHQIAREQGHLDEAGAKTFVQNLVKSKRYQRDVY
ncbi:sulfite reductase [NADPH] flavoprotein, alpha-component [Abditibacterium utsteinense]|uniref:assimilatory sulfite reductase (NADPH) n=1 Tax=Abditibacterium utsteinense TaxID=1960156 RepID=A0A2S8SR60_9BACT|nr:sulfite reductase subunit alpha [Abditibacterium utsteinense]PQV63301.1 sulfite reductase [NADPH] flavoprotein, alpha-component [Abditibacterium utsteinense]